jgi:hypothetical protein
MKPKRRTLLIAGTGLLYAGAVALGAAAGAAAAIPALLGLLMLYTVLMRPAAQWSGPGAVGALRLGLTVGVLGLLSVLLWAAGQGLALLAGAPPVWVGPVLSLVGVALSRAVWSARREAEMTAFLDEALAGITGLAQQVSAATEAARRRAQEEDDAAHGRLLAGIDRIGARLAGGAGAADLGPEIDALASFGDAACVWRELEERTATAPEWEGVLLAFLAHPRVDGWEIHELNVSAAVARALAGPEPELQRQALAAAAAWASRPHAFIERAALIREELAPLADGLAPEERAALVRLLDDFDRLERECARR